MSEVRLPRSAKVNAHTADCDVVPKGLGGELDFTTGDGRLELDEVNRTLCAHTSDGLVRVSGRFDVFSNYAPATAGLKWKRGPDRNCAKLGTFAARMAA